MFYMMMPVMWGFMGWMWIYWIISIVFILWALIDIADRKKDAGYKFIWALICIILGIIGVLLYYVTERRK